MFGLKAFSGNDNDNDSEFYFLYGPSWGHGRNTNMKYCKHYKCQYLAKHENIYNQKG